MSLYGFGPKEGEAELKQLLQSVPPASALLVAQAHQGLTSRYLSFKLDHLLFQFAKGTLSKPSFLRRPRVAYSNWFALN